MRFRHFSSRVEIVMAISASFPDDYSMKSLMCKSSNASITLYKVDGDSGYWASLGLDIAPGILYNNLVGASIKYLLIPSIDAPLIFKRDSKKGPMGTGLNPQVLIY
jgi:hypothetical protein